jgi:hypothetical protein
LSFFEDILGDNYFDDFIPGSFDGPGGAVAGNVLGISSSSGTPEQPFQLDFGNSIYEYLLDAYRNNGAIGRLSSGLVGTGVRLAPYLEAIDYSRNLQEPDVSRLQESYNRYSSDATAFPYDIETARSRGRLASGLSNRGLSGSSIAQNDWMQFNTLREMGRGNLLSQGAESQSRIAGDILKAQQAAQKSKFDLYSRSLLALTGSINQKA